MTLTNVTSATDALQYLHVLTEIEKKRLQSKPGSAVEFKSHKAFTIVLKSLVRVVKLRSNEIMKYGTVQGGCPPMATVPPTLRGDWKVLSKVAAKRAISDVSFRSDNSLSDDESGSRHIADVPAEVPSPSVATPAPSTAEYSEAAESSAMFFALFKEWLDTMDHTESCLSDAPLCTRDQTKEGESHRQQVHVHTFQAAQEEKSEGEMETNEEMIAAIKTAQPVISNKTRLGNHSSISLTSNSSDALSQGTKRAANTTSGLDVIKKRNGAQHSLFEI